MLEDEDMKKAEARDKAARDKADEDAKKASEMTQEDIDKNKEEMRKQIESAKAEELNKKLNADKDREKGKFEVKFDKTYDPKFNWQAIVKKMMPTGDPEKEETYSKVSRKNPAGIKMLKDTGRGRAKQGITDVDPEKRDILFVIDNSGSMMEAIGKVNKELETLFLKFGDSIENCMFIKFDSKFELWKADLKNKTAQEIKSSDINKIIQAKGDMKKIKPKDKKVPFKQMFDVSGLGGGTEFDETIIKLMHVFLKKGASAVLASDQDILWNKNAKNVSRLIQKWGKVPFKLNIILNNRDNFDRFVKEIQGYKYLSHF